MPESSYQRRMRVYDSVDRAVKMATTYLRKSSNLLYVVDAEQLDRREAAGGISVWYWTLLEQAIETAIDIVEKLPDDYFEPVEGLLSSRMFNSSDNPLEKAQKLLTTIEERRGQARRARRIRALEDTTGRTPEEAELYRQAAERLRAG